VHKAVVSAEGAERADVVIKISRHPSSLSVLWESHVLSHVRRYSPPDIQLLEPLWAGRAHVADRRDAICAVIPYAPGGDAINWVQKQTYPLTKDRTREIFADIANTLHAFHSNGIAHLDICMENLLFSSAGRCCIADAGLASNLMPKHYYWHSMRAACSVAALHEYKKWEAYSMIASSYNQDEINAYIKRKITQMEHMPFAANIRAELGRIIESPPHSRLQEAWTEMYGCILRMSSICAKSSSGSYDWYEHKLLQRIGRVQYRPPESEFCRYSPVDPLAWDVWTMGICMYAFVFRSMPFESTRCPRFAIFSTHGLAAIIPEDQRSAAPDEALEVIELCLRINPSTRIKTSQLLRHPFLTMK